MGIEQRRHPRFGVHIAVRYTNAEQFVTDYVENLSMGGLFIAGAHQLEMHTETEVTLELPGQGSWTVLAKTAFIIDDSAARASGRRAGAGMEVLAKPPGFDDALLGYLLRLGQRRDHCVMVGGKVGMRVINDAGYKVIPLEAAEVAATYIRDDSVKLIAIVLPADKVDEYRAGIGDADAGYVMGVRDESDLPDILSRIDSLL